MSSDLRKSDEERIMLAFKKADGADAATRAILTVSLLADLLCDVRNETIAKCRVEVDRALALVRNEAMTSERLGRLLHDDQKEGTR